MKQVEPALLGALEGLKLANRELPCAGEDPERFRPSETHALTEELKRRSREISNAAQMRRYTARDTRGSG